MQVDRGNSKVPRMEGHKASSTGIVDLGLCEDSFHTGQTFSCCTGFRILQTFYDPEQTGSQT